MRAGKVFKKFPKTFWVANSIELFERWAWYGFDRFIRYGWIRTITS